jgi:hypothetical protein
MTWPPSACVYDWHDPCATPLQGARLAALSLTLAALSVLASDSSELRNDVLISIHADRQLLDHIVARSKLRVW